jgi:hypothetical protein
MPDKSIPKVNSANATREIPDHGTADLGCFEDIVLLDNRQDIAAEFPHLPIVFLDHADAPRDFERSGGFFEDSDFRHRSRHGDDLLPPVIRDQEVNSGN